MTSLAGHHDPLDRVTGFERFVTPMQNKRQKLLFLRLQFLERLALKSRNYAANKPASLAQLNDCNQTVALIKGFVRFASIK